MATNNYILDILERRAHSLRSRIQQIKPFTITMPMVKAAAFPDVVENKVERMIKNGCSEIENNVKEYLVWLNNSKNNSKYLDAQKAQKKFTLLKLRFNALHERIDIYSDVYTQRSEHETGVLLKGLDQLAIDGLRSYRNIIPEVPIICYLERGLGAAIRRFTTKLPGRKKAPVTIIRIPRERIISPAIAASILHEVGHQVAALLGLNNDLRSAIEKKMLNENVNKVVWNYFKLWASEIIADFWAITNLGISATDGLMGVVSLPRYFIFRVNPGDPHPFPWIRVIISIHIGKAVYPQANWDQLINCWHKMYPLSNIKKSTLQIVQGVERSLPEFIRFLLNFRTPKTKNIPLKSLVNTNERTLLKLRSIYAPWINNKNIIKPISPVLFFAALGQAAFDNKISVAHQTELIMYHLKKWAMQ